MIGELKVVLDREIEEQIQRIDAALARDRANGLPFDGFERGIGCFLDLGAIPDVAQDSAAFEFRREAAAKFRIRIKLFLRLDAICRRRPA